ncbi:MAG: aminodeoxychorismate synthase component I [Desulfuromonadaceae bacterium]|nr:aminodeoxychorismate synthase component I [Desulfuromonadaceae bacterium]
MIDSDPVLVIHDAECGQWLMFKTPVEIVVATTVKEVVEALRHVEVVASNHGLYAVGYVGYQASAAFDSRLVTRVGGELPLLWFGMYATATVVDLPLAKPTSAPFSWHPRYDKNNYLKAIAAIKQYISQGYTYQVNYTYPLDATLDADVDAWAFFLAMQHAQQGKYGAFIDLGRFAICSASPELFFSRKEDLITTRPMKGTAPRGADRIADLRFRDELAHCPKNRAENLMIVDMLRNDLGRIAEIGSVHVDQLFQVEGYPTLWQMTTRVQARSRCSIVELFTALFPCASITGAPKVRSMEIIAELESSPRQIYTGSIGFIAPDGRAQFSVAIRTALIDRQQCCAEYPVGGGIIWDSDAQQEYCETMTKAKVLTSKKDQPRLLETLLWEPATGFRFLEQHLQRLNLSAQRFGYPLQINSVRQRLINAAAAQPLQRWRVRCLLAATGQLSLEFIPQPYLGQLRALHLVLAREPIDSADEFFRHKTEERQRFTHMLEAARHEYGAQVDDVVLFNQRDEITETTIANIVIYQNGKWVTPPCHSGLLAGILRQILLEQGVIEEQVITVGQLRDADQIYLINSVRGWRWAKLSC